MYLTHDKTTTKEFDTIEDARKTGLAVFVPVEELDATHTALATTATQRDALLALAQATADTVTGAIAEKAKAKSEAEKAKAELAKAKESKW